MLVPGSHWVVVPPVPPALVAPPVPPVPPCPLPPDSISVAGFSSSTSSQPVLIPSPRLIPTVPTKRARLLMLLGPLPRVPGRQDRRRHNAMQQRPHMGRCLNER